MRVAFVSPFYGESARGGAEAECRKTAIHLAQAGVDVDVCTTCLVDLVHGLHANTQPAGACDDSGVTVRRFRSEWFDSRSFSVLNERLIRGETLSPAEEQHFMACHVNSFDMYRYLAEHGAGYDWLCFIPYLFGTSCYGSRLWPGKSVLIPCLHVEGYARLAVVREMFGRVAQIVFHSRAEADLATTLYGDLGSRGVVLGEGVDTDDAGDAQRFRDRFGIDSPFVLYAGRKDRTKNTDLLVDLFARSRVRRSGAKLVLIGPASVPMPRSARKAIVDLGFVTEEEKQDAYAAASVLCQPSVNESFSLVLMEAWLRGTPCLVHGDCAVTREHVEGSGGGLSFNGQGEFDDALDRLLASSGDGSAMGEKGRQYVRENFSWPHITRRFLDEVFIS